MDQFGRALPTGADHRAIPPEGLPTVTAALRCHPFANKTDKAAKLIGKDRKLAVLKPESARYAQ